LTVRYGIRWDGRGRPRIGAAAAAVFAALALWAAPVAQGDSATAKDDSGAGAANAAMDVTTGGSGVERHGPSAVNAEWAGRRWSGRRWSGASWIDESGG
jgi:hypothetical protein